jgi:ParB family chromosome partitioning protein
VSDEESFQLALVENLQRADLNPIEEALGYRTLLQEQGLTQAELAKIVSKSRSAVTNTLRLLDLPPAVQELMAEGKLSAGHARAILAVPDAEARERLARKVVAEGLSVRATERLAPLFSPVPRVSTPRLHVRGNRLFLLGLLLGFRRLIRLDGLGRFRRLLGGGCGFDALRLTLGGCFDFFRLRGFG